jgi:transposase
MEYKQEGEAEGKKGQRAAYLLEGVQGRSGGVGGKKGKPISRTAVDLSVNESVLRRWMQQAREAAQGGPPPLPGHGRSQDEELVRLRKEVKFLREADEILKKVAAIFAQTDPR